MSKPFSRNSIAAFFLSAAVAVLPAGGAFAVGKQEPIVITADSMRADRLHERVDFRGNVTLKREGMTLSSDTASVYYAGPKRGIRQIEALGNVVVRKEGSVAHAQRALYYNKEEKIVLTGDARIVEGENEIGGDRITLYLQDDRSVVEGGNVRFYQEKRDQDQEDQGAQKEKPGAGRSR